MGEVTPIDPTHPKTLVESAKKALAVGMPMDNVGAIALVSIAESLARIADRLDATRLGGAL